MSEVTYEAMIDEQRPTWAQTGESVFKITSGAHEGRIVVVRMYKTGEDIDGDGEEDLIHAETQGYMADPETGETIMVAGRKVQCAAYGETETLARGDDEDGIDLGEWVMSCYDRCVFRVLRRIESVKAVANIPTNIWAEPVQPEPEVTE